MCLSSQPVVTSPSRAIASASGATDAPFFKKAILERGREDSVMGTPYPGGRRPVGQCRWSMRLGGSELVAGGREAAPCYPPDHTCQGFLQVLGSLWGTAWSRRAIARFSRDEFRQFAVTEPLTPHKAFASMARF